MANKKEKEVKDKITISITPELHSALIMAALEHRTSISQIIENTLRNAEEFKEIFLPKVREYNDDKAPELTAASPHSLKHLRREEPEKEEDLGRLRGGPLDYGPIRFRLVHPPNYEQIVEKARSYGVDIPSDQKPHSQKKKKIKL